MAQIKKITINVSNEKKNNRLCETIKVDIETDDPEAWVKGSTVLKILNDAMSMVIEKMNE